jgi:PAS domain S-box-containing protein
MNETLKKRIKELENTYSLISDNLLDAIWVVDADTLRYEYITPSIKKMSGYKAEEYSSLTIKDNLTPESLKKAISILSEERKKISRGFKNIRTLELELIAKDGSHYWVEIRSKFYRERGKQLKVVGVSRNITQRKKAEQKQQELIKKLQESIEEKERLLNENRVLRGLLPLCSGCRRIRDEHGKWWPLDAYVTRKTETQITHTICPDCKDVYYSE